MDITALRNLTYGLYVVGTNDNGRPTGCIINTCFQVTSENPIVAISMNKNNYTHDIIVRHGKFSLAILAEESDTSLITTFGFQCGRDRNKYTNYDYEWQNDVPILSLGGAVFGMGEEALPFTMILCPLFVAVGYDTVIAVLVTYVATQIGFGSSWMNPFSVGIAQGIAGVDVFSGAGFRMVMWVVFTALGCGMTMFYAAKVKKTPEISVAYESDQYFRDQNEKTGIDEGHSFGIGHILVLVTLAVTVVWVIWGVMAKGYYMAEIATQFFIMGIVAGVIGVIFHLNDMKVNDIAVSFKDGAKDLIGAALVVAMAQGIMQVLGGSDPTTPTVINTIMYGISQALAGLSGAAAAVLMYVFQSVFNFFVVSGSGQAAITMPIMAPLADLLGVSRQTSVLAFQLGDAFTNLIVPTSGCLIGSLAIAKIEWSNWIKCMWKFLGILMIGAVITILIAVAIGF